MKFFTKVIEIIDWVLYIILCIVAIYFIMESSVIQQYVNKNTDTYETIINDDELLLPEFTICDWRNSFLGMEFDYDIQYFIKDFTKGTEKKNDKFQRQSLYGKQCFVIVVPLSDMILSDHVQYLVKIRFNSSLKIEDLPQISGIVSSKNNPEILGIFYDGNYMQTTIRPQERAIFKGMEERSEYLPETCRIQPIFQYLATEFIENNINCSLKCLPEYLNSSVVLDKRLTKFPICENAILDECIMDWTANTLKYAKTFCNMVSYVGKVDKMKIDQNEAWCSQVLNKFLIKCYQ